MILTTDLKTPRDDGRRASAPLAILAFGLGLFVTADRTLADGGNGGSGAGGSAGGTGGTLASNGSPGVDGTSNSGGGGGGGGGGGTSSPGGASGGTGGASYTAGIGSRAAGGLGGTSPGSAGNDGTPGNADISGGGGGGGGGGQSGFFGGPFFLGGSLSAGGNGGNGGVGGIGSNVGGGGGGGGEGGDGAYVSSGNVSIGVGQTVSGGNGGNGGAGGNGAFFGGNGGLGGAGGIGLSINAATVTNLGTIQGGNGGLAGTGGTGHTANGLDGTVGPGGAGIFGHNLNIVNSGMIAGGLSGDGATRANAISFSGSANSLEIRAGSNIVGNVSGGSNNAFTLGGTTDASFDVSKIGTQFRNFTTFNKTGTSVWTLTGTTAQTTAWQIAGGFLAAASDGALGNGTLLFVGGGFRYLASFSSTRSIDLEGSGGTFDTNGYVATLNGAVTGNGGLTKIGAGTLVLANGRNTYSGTTDINGGTLEVDGAVTRSNINVNSGGTLAGVGKIGDPKINSGGTLAPGSAADPYGTLTIAGPLSFQPGSVFAINVAPGGRNSAVNVIGFGGAAGTVTINGGTVQVNAGQGTYTTGSRTILTAAGGITGRFDNVTSNLAFLLPTLSYGANALGLNLTGNAPGTPSGIDYRTAALTLNQIAVSTGLTNAGNANGGKGEVLTALNQLTVPQARAAFDNLSGEGYTAAQNVADRSSALFTSAIFDQTVFYPSGGNTLTLPSLPPGFSAYAPRTDGRAPLHELADLPSTRPAPIPPSAQRADPGAWRAWATGFGASDTFRGNALPIGSATQDDTIYGGALGVDYQLMANYRVGVAVGGSDGAFAVPDRVTSGSTTGGHIAFYDIAEFGPFYGASSTAFSYFTNRATRSVAAFGGLAGETERGAFNSREFRSRLEFGRHLGGAGGSVTPFVALEIADLRSNGFGETSISGPGNFLLNVSGQSQASVPAYVGARFQSVVLIGGMVVTPSLQLAYIHEFSPQRTEMAAVASLPGSTFLVDGARPARDAAQVKAGGDVALTPTSFLFASFDGEFANVSQSYAGKGGLKLLW